MVNPDPREYETTIIKSNMSSETISIWDLAARCRKAKEAACRAAWEELVKWMYFQFKSEHHVSFGRLGNYGYKI